MSKYSPRHTLAILRRIIGYTQQELALLVGRSPRTVQAIEIGRLALSEDLAVEISHATGVSVRWLLEGNIAVPAATAMSDMPFSKKIFEETRASIALGKDPNPLTINASQLGDSLEAQPLPLMRQMFEQINSLRHPHMDYWLASIMSSIFAAAKTGRAQIAIYRLAEFDKAMRKEFGQRLDGEFTRDATIVFENGLQRVKGAEILVGKNGPVSSSKTLSGAKGEASNDFLSDALLGPGLTEKDVQTLRVALNGVGDRIQAREASLEKTYEILMEQMKRVFASGTPSGSEADQSAFTKTSARKKRKTGGRSQKSPKG